MVLLEFSMSPMDKGESVSDYVSRSLKIISESGVDYRLNPMGTVLEGEWDEVMTVVKRCYETMRSDCKRITCSVKILLFNENDDYAKTTGFYKACVDIREYTKIKHLATFIVATFYWKNEMHRIHLKYDFHWNH